MSKLKVLHKKINSEPLKFPFNQTFLCPKCSEILFVKIYYIESTMIPQVKYICPKRHSGSVDLPLFFNLFHSTYEDIEDELSKFDENLEKDIETFKAKKMKDRKILDPINFVEIMNKNKEKEKEIQNKEEIKKSNEDNKNKLLFKEIKKCNEIKFSLLNIKKEIKEPKILEKQYSKSETKNKEKIENKSPEIKNQIKKLNKNNKNSFSQKAKTNIINNINIIKNRKEDIKEEEKRFTGYCISCKKNMCKKCFKKKGHKKRKIFPNVVLKDKNLDDLNKGLNQCQERLITFENKVHSLIEELTNKEKNKKMILNIMTKAYIDLNRENLKQITDLINLYVNCVKKGMLNYETILDVKNLDIKNVIMIPNSISELIQILNSYKIFIVQKYTNKNHITLGDQKNKENKYIQLFDAFFELLKNYENKDINFRDIEDENFGKILSSNDYGNIEEDKKEENKIITTEEKEMNEIEKMEKFYMNYFDDGYENYEEYLEEEEDENEIEYEDDYDDYNVEDIEDEYNYVLNENMRMEQHEHENKECK